MAPGKHNGPGKNKHPAY